MMISISNKFLGCHDSIVEPTSLCKFFLNFHHQKVLELSTMASLKQVDLLEMEMTIGIINIIIWKILFLLMEYSNHQNPIILALNTK